LNWTLRERGEIVRSRRLLSAGARPLKLIVSCRECCLESFGIALALLGGLVAAPLFCWALAKFVRPFLLIANLGFRIAAASVALFLLELLLVYALGIVGTRRLIGPAFFPLHALLTLGIAPACACALLLGDRFNLARWWPLVAVFCWFVGAAAIFYQYEVAETLYGIDGRGGPYQGL
jgi:hypothetical protein